MAEGVERVRARIEQIQALIEKAGASNEEFGRELERAVEGERPSDPSETAVAAARTHAARPVAPAELAPVIAEAAEKSGLSQALISAVISAESGFRPDAVSPAGARGLMQLMPGTARALGVADPFDPQQNVLGGARYLEQQLRQFGSIEKALAAYNAGPGAVQRYGGIPPYPETQNYVRRVLSMLRGLNQRE
jgi:soluble lytic murein transglycosylase-like protein